MKKKIKTAQNEYKRYGEMPQKFEEAHKMKVSSLVTGMAAGMAAGAIVSAMAAGAMANPSTRKAVKNSAKNMTYAAKKAAHDISSSMM